MKKRPIKLVGKYFISLVLIVALMSCLTLQAMAEEPGVLEARNSVVRIVTVVQVSYEHEQNFFSGTGFFVGESGKDVQYVVTNRHVVDVDSIFEEMKSENKNYRYSSVEGFAVYVLIDGQAYQIDYVKDVTLSQIADLAILKLPKAVPIRKPAKLGSQSDVKVTDTIYALGYPGYSDVDDVNNTVLDDSLENFLVKAYTSGVENISVTQGAVVKTNVVIDGITHTQHNATISYGNSGGPLVNAAGAVVGVNAMSTASNIGATYYSIDTDVVKTLLKQNNIKFVDAAASAATAGKNSEQTKEPESSAAETTDEGNEEESKISTGMIAGIAGAAVLVAVLVAVLAKKNRKPPLKQEPGKGAPIKTVPVKPTAKPLTAVVRSLSEQHQGKKIAIGKEEVFLGRTKDCKILYKDGTPGVSGRHCSIAWDANKNMFVLKDLESTYGTFLESGMKLEPNKPYMLRPGETFYLGEKDNSVRLEVE